MRENRNFAEIEKRIGYTFSDRSILKTALTHRSYLNESKGRTKSSYERLEFLGDAVLENAVSDYLYRNYPGIDEGRMSKIRSTVVCEEGLFDLAQRVGLGEFVYMSHGEEMSGGRSKPSILSDVTEAVIAAVYLDSGFDTAYKFILTHLESAIRRAATGNAGNDYKSRLHEYAAINGDRVSYEVVAEDGPEHEKVFTVALLYNGKREVTAEGAGKKKAEQQAAMFMLKKLGR